MSVDRNERMDVFFDTLAEGAAATQLVILDPTVSKRRQHVATFAAADGLLKTYGSNRSLTVEASVDTSLPSSSRRGERLGGTTLGSLATVKLEIDGRGLLVAGSTFAAQATYVKNIGESLTQDFDCVLFEGSRAPEELSFY